MTARDIIVTLSIKYRGKWEDIFSAIESKEQLSPQDVENTIKNINCNFLTILDADYPESLKKLTRPPFVIFYEGDLSLLETTKRHLAVVGTRNPNPKFVNAASKIITELPNDVVIVSGLAKGIDAAAHSSALKSGKKTIAVIGNGIDITYPIINKDLQQNIKEKGLIISEYPLGVEPESSHFPIRNRLIAALSGLIFVPQAFERSGSLITVGCALELNKDIVCLPSEDYGHSACNILIKEGAFLAETAQDINEILN